MQTLLEEYDLTKVLKQSLKILHNTYILQMLQISIFLPRQMFASSQSKAAAEK